MNERKSIYFTLLLAGIIVGLASFVVPKNESKYLEGMFWTTKTFGHKKYDIVLMGDSRVYRGVDPSEMGKVLSDKKIFNFAYSDGGLNPTMFEAAEKKLSGKLGKQAILLGITANTITGYSQDNKQYFSELKRPREERWEQMYLNPMLYWFSATTPQKLYELATGVEHPIDVINNFKDDGYVESEKFPHDTSAAVGFYESDFRKFIVEERYVSTLINQVATWSYNDILVVGFRPPVSMPMRELEDSAGHYCELCLKSKFEAAGGYWININPNEFETYDGSHLSIESAKHLSHMLAIELDSLLRAQKIE